MIKLIKLSTETATLHFESEYDLWHYSDFFCISDKSKLLRLESDNMNNYRFQKSGNLIVHFDSEAQSEIEKLSLFVLFKNNVEIINIDLR